MNEPNPFVPRAYVTDAISECDERPEHKLAPFDYVVFVLSDGSKVTVRTNGVSVRIDYDNSKTKAIRGHLPEMVIIPTAANNVQIHSVQTSPDTWRPK